MTDERKAEDVVRWYCVSREGMATLCVDEEDARRNAAVSKEAFPFHAPYRAAQLVDAAALESLTARVAELSAAVDAEREACARACEAEHISRRLIDDHRAYNSALRNAASAIRQRAGRG
jgi:hypothetical protein